MAGSSTDNLSPQNDDQLVQRVQGGDREAYRALVERYQGRLFAMALDILKVQQDAEDVVQETFVKAFLSLKQFKGESSFYTWLYRICFNMAVDIKRKSDRRGGAHLEYKEDSTVNKGSFEYSSAAGEGSAAAYQDQRIEGPYDALARRELGAGLQMALTRLTEEQRAVIMLREIDGLDYEEIAQAIGAPKGTVMSRLFYARKALQEALQEFSPTSTSLPRIG